MIKKLDPLIFYYSFNLKLIFYTYKISGVFYGGGVFGFFLFFICFFFVCFINLFDSYLFLNINMYFSSCSCLRFFIHHFIYFTSAKHHPTRPALLMPKPEVIICTSRHHIPSPMELKFSMNHPIFQVNHIMFTSVFVLTVYIIWPFCQYYL